MTSQSMEELYTITKKREQELKRLGYKLVIVWEHEFMKQITRSEPLQIYLSRLDIQERLNPRESFFGSVQMLSNFIVRLRIAKRFIIMILPVFTHGQTNIVNIP